MDDVSQLIYENKWSVEFTKQVQKEIKKLPKIVKDLIKIFVYDIEEYGPYIIYEKWFNYHRIKSIKNAYRCHLKQGKPTYIIKWCKNKTDKIIEVYSVGTHEKYK